MSPSPYLTFGPGMHLWVLTRDREGVSMELEPWTSPPAIRSVQATDRPMWCDGAFVSGKRTYYAASAIGIVEDSQGRQATVSLGPRLVNGDDSKGAPILYDAMGEHCTIARPARFFRRFPFGEIARFLRENFTSASTEPSRSSVEQDVSGVTPTLARHQALLESSHASARRSGKRRPMPDEDCARAARLYVRAMTGGTRHPVVDVANQLQVPRHRARAMIYQARQRGSLTRGTQGKPGGALTPRGLALARAGGNRKRPAGKKARDQ